MSVDPQGPVPLYFQLKTLLLGEIVSGHYRPGERLPTEEELCERYGISRTPVHRALAELAQEGVIVRRRRSGSFVNPAYRGDRAKSPETVRMVVPKDSWEEHIRHAAPADVHVEVETVSLPELHAHLTRAVAEARAPDLAVLDSVWLPQFAADGFLFAFEELRPRWIEAEHKRDFFEPFQQANRHEGATFAVQAEADVAGVWYATDVLRAAGHDAPSSWSELAATARVARTYGWEHPLVMPGGAQGGETTTYCLLAFLAANDAAVLDRDGVRLDSPQTVETLRFLRSLVEEGLMPIDVVDYEWDEPIGLLAEGRAAISVGGSYEARMLADATGLTMDELPRHFQFAPVPIGGRDTTPQALAGGMVYGIFRQAGHPQAAAHLIEQLVQPEPLAAMARATGQLPPRRSALELVTGESEFLARTARMLETATVRPPTPAFPRVSAQLRSMVADVLTGRFGPATAAERTTDLIAAITGLPALHPGLAS